jgi:hypothetical protein
MVDALDARDRRIVGAVIRALQRLLEHDGIAPALAEDQRARVLVQDGKVLLIAAVSTPAAQGEDEGVSAPEQPGAPLYRLPPLRERAPRRFAFG